MYINSPSPSHGVGMHINLIVFVLTKRLIYVIRYQYCLVQANLLNGINYTYASEYSVFIIGYSNI